MRRTVFVPLFLVASLATTLPAAAVPCSLDEPAAATLLLPHFEVDPAGSVTTLFSIGNATSEPTLTRVTLWSDLGVPVLWFNVYLTGWDVQTINLRDVLNGNLPETATPAAEAKPEVGSFVSPRGLYSLDGDFPGCAELLPPEPLPASQVAHLQAALSGRPSPLFAEETCFGFPWGDGRARGWVTVDVVDRCSTTPPGSDYYGPAGELGFANVLWGDFYDVDPSENQASGGNLVRIEADPELFAAGDRTFYGTWVDGSAADGREPLPTVWATRYATRGLTGTQLVYWRDPGEVTTPYACEVFFQIPWFPLGDREPVIFDEDEDPQLPEGCTVLCSPEPPLMPFYFQSARLPVNGPDLPIAFDFGWIYVDLGLDDRPTQSWLGTMVAAEGRYSVTTAATPLDEPCTPGHPAPGEL